MLNLEVQEAPDDLIDMFDVKLGDKDTKPKQKKMRFSDKKTEVESE